MSIECKCSRCVAACQHKPGWFAPGEAERAAELLGLSLPEFFKTRLMVDWYENWRGLAQDEECREVFVLSPAVVGGTPGEEFPGDPRGTCVFLKDGLCEIHAAKPHECAGHIHDEAKDLGDARKRAITHEWSSVVWQQQVRELLEREPYSSEYHGGGLFGGLFGGLCQEDDDEY